MDTAAKVTGTDPLVSIIMLTYNRAEYIEAAIESALAQTYTNFELIILDDGSTDNTAAIVARFTDPRICYLRSPDNRGLYERRKESLDYVHGSYVAILDSDDIWIDREKLAIQVGYLEQFPDCAVVGTFITLIDEAGRVIGNTSYETSDTSIRSHLLSRNQFANSSVLMRKRFLDKTEGYRNFAPCEDLELFLQLGQFGTFANLPEYMIQYRIHQGGESFRKMRVAKTVARIIRLHRDRYKGAAYGLAKMQALYFWSLARSLLRR